jgi:hypothetical protein
MWLFAAIKKCCLEMCGMLREIILDEWQELKKAEFSGWPRK